MRTKRTCKRDRILFSLAHQPRPAIVKFFGLDREGDALLVAGSSSAGTQPAADFLLSGRSFAQFLRQVERKDGSIPHFELLLEARSVGGNVPGSNVVAYRSAPLDQVITGPSDQRRTLQILVDIVFSGSVKDAEPFISRRRSRKICG